MKQAGQTSKVSYRQLVINRCLILKALSTSSTTTKDNRIFTVAKRKETCPTERRQHGGIAQLGERLLCKQEVNGSIPFISTTGRGNKNRVRNNGLIAQPVRAHA